jgi:acyl-coenzyme A synthetase/AMP-(fatty) acid ligase
VTDAPDQPGDGSGAPSPRPGSLEHLARGAPDGTAAVDARTGRTLTRREHDAAADALADGLADEHGIAAGARVAVALPGSLELLIALFALAKLGAAPVLLPPGLTSATAGRLALMAGSRLLITGGPPASVAPADDLQRLSAMALGALTGRHSGAPSRFSGEQLPADGVQLAGDPDHPRLVLRSRSAERIALLATSVGDLLARTDLPHGGVHLLAPGAHRAEPQFWAGVALVTGGAVATLDARADDGHALLAALEEQAVTSTVLDGVQLRALLALPAAVTESADLTALGRVLVCGGEPLDAALVAAAADLLGEDVLQSVHATAQTGPVAHADTAALSADPFAAGRPLAGVTVTADDAGRLWVRSPLTADGALGDSVARGDWPAPPAWRDAPVPTEHHGEVTADGRVRVTGPASPAL